MGYTTDFYGSVVIEPALNEHEIAFLKDLARTRRMDRSKGPLYIDDSGEPFGQTRADDVIDYNSPPKDQPGLWLQWEPNDEGTELSWDGGEKFYHAEEWMMYIVHNLLGPAALEYITTHSDEDKRLEHFTCNHTVNGVIEAYGEDRQDMWRIVVKNNVVSSEHAELVWPSES